MASVSDTPSRATRSSKRTATTADDKMVHEQNNNSTDISNNNDNATATTADDGIPKSLSKEMNMSELNINSREKKEGSTDDDDDTTELLVPIQKPQPIKSSDKNNDNVIMADESSKIGGGDDINNAMEVDSKPAAKIGDSSEGSKVAVANKQEPPMKNNTVAVGEEARNNAIDTKQNNIDIQPTSEDIMAATATGVTSATTNAASSTTSGTNVSSAMSASNTNTSKEEGEKVAKDFSLTLAIGPTDAQRVYHASKAFNIEIQRLQKANDDAQISSIGGGGSGEQTKRKSMDDTNNTNNSNNSNNNSKVDKKKLPVVVHSPPSREEPLKPTGAAGAVAPMKPPPPILNNPSLAAPPPPVAAAATTSTPSSSSSLMNDNNQQQKQHTTTTPPQQQKQQPLRNLLITAAQSTNNTLITNFLKQMDVRNMSIQEKQTSLLFFLDADKSTKLLAAFDIFGSSSSNNSNSGGDTNKKKQGEDEEKDDDGGESKFVQRTGLISLFQSFLTSISSCVHGCDGDDTGSVKDDEKKSASRASTPTVQNTSPAHTKKEGGDWKGSKTTLKEILQVATFAADNLIDFAKKEENNNNASASFDTFGKWYNSGGFSLVPWLELLDLSKWDYTGHHGENHVPKTTSAYASFPSSSSKRARIQTEPLTPGLANMSEPIGSPTAFFASGAKVGSGITPSKLYESGGIGCTYSSVNNRNSTFKSCMEAGFESRTVAIGTFVW